MKLLTPIQSFHPQGAKSTRLARVPENASLSELNLRPLAHCFSESGHLKEERLQARGSPQKPSKTDRIAQLCALALDPNQDTAECAWWNLFHEFPNAWESL